MEHVDETIGIMNCMGNNRDIQHSLLTLNMWLNRLAFNWILTKLHVDHFSLNQTFSNISEGVLLSNSTCFFIIALCIHCFQYHF